MLGWEELMLLLMLSWLRYYSSFASVRSASVSVSVHTGNHSLAHNTDMASL